MANISNLAEKVFLIEFLLISVEPTSAANRQFHQIRPSIPDPFHSQIKDFQIHQYLKPSYPLNLGEAWPVTEVFAQKTPPARGNSFRSKFLAAVVMNKRFLSGPPNAQLVTWGTGISRIPSMVPSGRKRVIRLPPQCASQTAYSSSTVNPSAPPSPGLSSAKSLRLERLPSSFLSNA